VVEEQLKSSTIGLVTLEEMKEKQEILVKAREKQIAAKLATKTSDQETKKQQKKSRSGALSFNLNEDEEEEEEASPSPPNPKKKRLGKDPAVDTSFLPDRDREVTTYYLEASTDLHVYTLTGFQTNILLSKGK
jgi:protein FAM50